MGQDDTTPPRGMRTASLQLLTQEQILALITEMQFDLDCLTQAFGLLMKAHNLESQWRTLQRTMSDRRRNIGQ